MIGGDTVDQPLANGGDETIQIDQQSASPDQPAALSNQVQPINVNPGQVQPISTPNEYALPESYGND